LAAEHVHGLLFVAQARSSVAVISPSTLAFERFETR
jgi:hypothetical protein